MHNSQYQHRNIYMLEQIPPKKGQHRKLTLEKKILPQLLPRIESMPFHQFLSQVWSSTTVRRGGEGCLSTNELSIIHAPQFDEYLLCTTDQWEVLLLDEQSTFGSWHIYMLVSSFCVLFLTTRSKALLNYLFFQLYKFSNIHPDSH